MKNLTWEKYFLALAKVVSLRSKDPNTKVGAIIVDLNNRIIATGYNGMPKGDDTFPWERNNKKKELNKYPYVIHAEMNAVLNSIKKVKNSIIYVTLFPCSDCAKLLAHSGIKKIIYQEDKYADSKNTEISKTILKNCNVKFQKGIDVKVVVE